MHACTHTHTHTHTHMNSDTHSLTHTHTVSHIVSLSVSLTHTHTHSDLHTYTHTVAHPTHSDLQSHIHRIIHTFKIPVFTECTSSPEPGLGSRKKTALLQQTVPVTNTTKPYNHQNSLAAWRFCGGNCLSALPCQSLKTGTADWVTVLPWQFCTELPYSPAEGECSTGNWVAVLVHTATCLWIKLL